MPTQVILYNCNICKKRWNTEAEALACEEIGIREEFPLYVIFSGTVYSSHQYSEQSFYITKNKLVKHNLVTNMVLSYGYINSIDYVSEITYYINKVENKHFENDAGSREKGKAASPFTPTFERLAEELKSIGKPVLYWNGSEIKEYHPEELKEIKKHESNFEWLQLLDIESL